MNIYEMYINNIYEILNFYQDVFYKKICNHLINDTIS
jgi:hypothetical protein